MIEMHALSERFLKVPARDLMRNVTIKYYVGGTGCRGMCTSVHIQGPSIVPSQRKRKGPRLAQKNRRIHCSLGSALHPGEEGREAVQKKKGCSDFAYRKNYHGKPLY